MGSFHKHLTDWIRRIVIIMSRTVLFYTFEVITVRPSIHLLPLGAQGIRETLNLHTVGTTPWRGDQPVARPLPNKHRINTDTQLCLDCDSNPRSYCSSWRKNISCLRSAIIMSSVTKITKKYISCLRSAIIMSSVTKITKK
jgi:hypothetical protein